VSATENHWQIREKIIEQCLWMNASGLNQGTSGNISVRYKQSMLITPSGVPYEQLQPQDIAKMSLKHNRFEWQGPYAPSSEWHFHRAILQSNAAYGAVVHTHSTYATVLSMGETNIPACHYMIAAFGGHTVRCAKYATFGTKKLSTNILKAMRNRSACLLGNHGMVVAGATLDKAMWAAVELETLSKQYYLASQMDRLNILPKDEINNVLQKFAQYGPKDKSVDGDAAHSDNGYAAGGNGELIEHQSKRDERASESAGFDRPAKTQPVIKYPV